ncbi:alpha/beta hydrolase [Lipingzhangella sp. LS1_29]|uniref:Alpha/beta hydrolase n=1 Tax=Lipingzhangella rawalii TaxID=2055835 RepID=A0ABU2H443_9ACTN|nr:alpha/beta hydrolase [Lipingzhangella rawalii]MDS1270061.1 alpha/beta hydrolase [Lipingzhangella rawalii]
MAAVPLDYRFDGPRSAPVVLLLGALGPQWTMWEPQLPELTRTARVLQIHHRGSGASPAPPGDYTLEELAVDVRAVLDRCAIDTVSVVGCGFGGMVAVQLAVSQPERVRRLALVSASARVTAGRQWWQYSAQVRASGTSSVVPALTKHWFTPAFDMQRPEIIDRLTRECAAMHANGLAGCLAAMAAADQRSLLARVHIPVVVVAAAHDTLTPPAHGKRLASMLPRARYERIPGGAHLVNIERSAAVNEAMVPHVVR